MNGKDRKILLVVLPYWIPESPPLGIAVLKSHLQARGFAHVRCHDFNVERDFWGLEERYVKVLKEQVTGRQSHDFFVETHALLGTHLEAFVAQGSDHALYRELVSFAIARTFRSEVPAELVDALHEVVVAFFARLDQRLHEVVGAYRPDVFGVSVFSSTLAPSLYAFRWVKAQLPATETLMGGGVFSDLLEPDSAELVAFKARTHDCIDAFLVGEGELLLERHLGGSAATAATTAGAATERGGEPRRLVPLVDARRETFDLDTAVPPDFSDFDVGAYTQLSMYTTRSCPFQCKFCSETVLGGTFRKKDVRRVVAELRELRQQYDQRLYILADSLLNPIITKLSEALLDADLGLYWDGHLRVGKEVCDPARTRLWAEAGYYRARLGIESGSQRMLELMHKQASVDMIRRSLQALAEAGIKTTTFWIVGYPGETDEDVDETLALIAELGDCIYEVDWHPFVFFPSGQVSSVQWGREHAVRPTFPERYDALRLARTYTLDVAPSPEQVFARSQRFARTVAELGIPSHLGDLMKIYRADRRWQKLHGKQIPTMMDLLPA